MSLLKHNPGEEDFKRIREMPLPFDMEMDTGRRNNEFKARNNDIDDMDLFLSQQEHIDCLSFDKPFPLVEDVEPTTNICDNLHILFSFYIDFSFFQSLLKALSDFCEIFIKKWPSGMCIICSLRDQKYYFNIEE